MVRGKTAGVRYYANEDLTGGHLSSMLTNAQKVSEYITDTHVPRRGGRYLPAVMEVLAMEEAQMKSLAARREFLENVPANLARQRLAQRHLAPRRIRGLLREHDHAVLALAKR